MKSEMRIFAFAPQTLKVWGVIGWLQINTTLAVARWVPVALIKVFGLLFLRPNTLHQML